MIIGITGNIGSGKSTFSKFAEDAGYPVLRADDISKSILQSDDKVKIKIVETFGKESFLNDKPNKSFLAQEVFTDHKKLLKLESILHPKVTKKLKEEIKKLKKTSNVIFIEAALVYEANLEELFDYVVLVTSELETRKLRKINGGMSEKDFLLRESNQIAEDEKKNRADFIFSNNFSVNELHSKFKLLQLTLGL